MAGTSDIYTAYLMQKGPLTQEESTLKDLLLRQQLYQYQPQSYTAAPSATATPSPAPSNIATPPIVGGGNNRDIPEFEGVMLPHVSQGDLISANYMNNIVDALNGIMDFLEQVTSTQPTTYYSALSATSSASPGVVGVVKEAVAEAADTGDTVTVKIPSRSVDASDFEALVYGKRRIDPSELVKTDDGGLSFQINKADIGTDNPELLAVAKGTNQQVLELFR